jgi:hypothetical protein
MTQTKIRLLALFFFIAIWAYAVTGFGHALSGGKGVNHTEIESIKKVIVKAYIEGIHDTQDARIATTGFHSDFAMLVPEESGAIRRVSVAEWLAFILNTAMVQDPKLWKSKTTYRFDVISATDHAASVTIQVYKGKKHFSTDYMLLYKFRSGWKIVSKTFTLW